jgi:hypothetical protein
MTRKMTVVFHDEDLYTSLKVEAARRHIPASKIMTDAVDAELLPVIEAAETEWKEKGGRPWSEVEQELDESIGSHRKTAEAKLV